MTRHVNQMRPQDDPNAPVYSPQRDLANIYLPMLREVFCSLDEKQWSPYLRELFTREGITEGDISESLNVLIEAHRLFIRDRSVSSVADAFTQAGVDRMSPTVRHAIFSRIGEVIIGGFFVALRDVTMQGELSSVHDPMAEMIAAGRGLMSRLAGQELIMYPVDAVEKARASELEAQRVVGQLQKELADANVRYADLMDTSTTQINTLQARFQASQLQVANAAPLVGFVQSYRAAPWYARFNEACIAFIRILAGKPLS